MKYILKDVIVFGQIFFYLLKLILDCDKLKKFVKLYLIFLFP